MLRLWIVIDAQPAPDVASDLHHGSVNFAARNQPRNQARGTSSDGPRLPGEAGETVLPMSQRGAGCSFPSRLCQWFYRVAASSAMPRRKSMSLSALTAAAFSSPSSTA